MIGKILGLLLINVTIRVLVAMDLVEINVVLVHPPQARLEAPVNAIADYIPINGCK